MNPARHGMISDSRGFALLITITLLAFLVLLLVSLASLTRVETQVASNARTLSVARHNTLFALNLALGRLQRHAGPDDRLTARSDITTAGPAVQPYLTGVWERANATNTPSAWLVSGDAANATDIADVLDPTAGSGLHADGAAPWAMLVGEASVDAPGRRVRLATRPIDAPAGTVPGLAAAATVGRYAWWIGDEGVKASASLVDALQLADPISYNSGGATGDNWADDIKRARLNQLQPVRPRVERVFGGLSPDTGVTARQLVKVSHPEQLGLVTGGPDITTRKSAFHAVTALSEAVLVDHYDSADIRLRRDLSDLGGTLHTGLSAGQSQSVRKYQEFRVTIPDPVAAPYAAAYKPAASITPSFPAFHAGPVVTEFGLRCGFDVQAGKVILVYWIDAEIWNPYAARLTTDATVQLSLDLATDITVTAQDDHGGSHPVNVTRLIREANGLVDTQWRGVLISTGEEWAPGEVKLLSGGSTLSSTAAVEGSLDTARTVVTGATKIVSVTLPALSQLELGLRANVGNARPALIQNQTPNKSFLAVASAPHPDLADPSAPRYAFGYGYRLVNNFSRWLQSSGTTGRDARYLSLDADMHDTGSSWDGDPTANINLSPDELFVNLDRLVFYDLPRQELVSVGDLRQLASRKTPEMGNSHGSTSGNRWFDHYFFSTVPRVHAWDFAGGEPLPNRYIRHVPSARAATTLADLRDDENAARFLLQRGAFNLNSTSVDAWRMMLGQRIAGWRGEATGAGTLDLDNVFFRLPHGAQQLANAPGADNEPVTNTPAADASATGGRRVTDGQISLLAQKIVDQLKTRGYPFASITTFLNSGVFRVALTDAGLLPANTASLPPGAGVTQADVVAQLAPVLTPRSDTFLIRAYGDARNPVTGDVEGRAWCEALVQRVPDVTEPASGAYAAGDELKLSAAKYPFGRKFKIISFRWLSPDDI